MLRATFYSLAHVCHAAQGQLLQDMVHTMTAVQKRSLERSVTVISTTNNQAQFQPALGVHRFPVSAHNSGSHSVALLKAFSTSADPSRDQSPLGRTIGIVVCALLIPAGVVSFTNGVVVDSNITMLRRGKPFLVKAALWRLKWLLFNQQLVNQCVDKGLAPLLTELFQEEQDPDILDEALEVAALVSQYVHGADELRRAGLPARLRQGIMQGWIGPQGLMQRALQLVEVLESGSQAA